MTSRTSLTVQWRWLLAVWICVAGIAYFDAYETRRYVALLDESGELDTKALPMHRPAPGAYADAQLWTRLALEPHSGIWRIDHTRLDNAPYGRPVFWNPAVARLIEATAHVRSLVTHEALAKAAEESLAWINLPLFLTVVVLASALIAISFGTAPGCIAATAFLGYPFFYDGFAPNNVDHHGVLTACCFGVVAGALVAFGRDHDAPRMRRRGMLCSAICGATGMWISAASVIPTLAAVALAGMVLSRSASRAEVTTEAALWRAWGRWGCALALAAYAVEFGPFRFGLRLEVNHPLYACPWAAGAGLVALTLERAWRDRRGRAALAVVFAVAPALFIFAAGSRVFGPLDPFVAVVHRNIDEFGSMFRVLRQAPGVFRDRFAVPLMALAPLLLLLRRTWRSERAFLLASVVVSCTTTLALVQVRWWLPASAAQICLLLVVMRIARVRVHVTAYRTLAAALIALLLVQGIMRGLTTRRNVEARAVLPEDAAQPFFRDVAAALRQSAPTRAITVLSSPTASAAISYFGGFASIGTLYWENGEGLKAAASMFSSINVPAVLDSIVKRGVTHVVLVTPDPLLETYLTYPDGRTPPSDSAFARLLSKFHRVPRWLKRLPFAPRANSPFSQAMLFAVDTAQSEANADWNAAVAETVAGESAGLEHFARIAEGTPANARASVYSTAGLTVLPWHADLAARNLLEASLHLERSTAASAGLAWLLATSRNDGVRDGVRSLQLTGALMKSAEVTPSIVETHAAALAATGNYDEAARLEQILTAQYLKRGLAEQARVSEGRRTLYLNHRALSQ